MPSCYAHYRFGAGAIDALPPEIRRVVRQFRRLYDAGLHGPDIFFYHNIFFRDSTGVLASGLHRQTGAELLAEVCQRLRQESGEAAQAYLYGLLAHFCLDAAAHPLVLEGVEEAEVGHAELETEFDRFLLQLDGHRQPNTYDGSGHLKLTDGECAAVARLWGNVTPGQVRASLRGMRGSMKLLSMPNGPVRRFVEKASGSRLRQYFMCRTPNRRCEPYNGPMLEIYEQALARLPEMAEALQAHLVHGTPLEGPFEATFNG